MFPCEFQISGNPLSKQVLLAVIFIRTLFVVYHDGVVVLLVVVVVEDVVCLSVSVACRPQMPLQERRQGCGLENVGPGLSRLANETLAHPCQVSLPRLVTVMCEPSSVLAFVPLCETVLEMALKAQSQGKTPYLSGFHLTPTQFVTPQNLLSCLVTFLYKFFGFTLWSSSDKTLVQMMITALVLTTHEDLAEREACGGALTKCTKVIVGLSLTEAFRHTTLSDHIHVLKKRASTWVHGEEAKHETHPPQ
ncbi:uncharacterized protein LOC129145999 isoform X2 [Talpa occidentalis]|uniref:uncharacterized protein LOC129145999 isoform X2 n=1 Tax=Talpa occidentalis TaxID=50954 RepID=UPI0023F9F011|nr:uncharacterized protein LOC129145999 isoform X2 [Talpa occidentalis]